MQRVLKSRHIHWHLPGAQASRIIFLLPLHHSVIVLAAIGQVKGGPTVARVDHCVEAHPRGDWVDQGAVELIVHDLACTAVVGGQDGFVHAVGFFPSVVALLSTMA